MSEHAESAQVRPLLPLQKCSSRQSWPSGSHQLARDFLRAAVWGSFCSVFHRPLVLLRGVSPPPRGLRLFLPTSVHSAITFHRQSSLKISCTFNSVLATASQGAQNDSVSTGYGLRKPMIKWDGCFMLKSESCLGKSCPCTME